MLIAHDPRRRGHRGKARTIVGSVSTMLNDLQLRAASEVVGEKRGRGRRGKGSQSAQSGTEGAGELQVRAQEDGDIRHQGEVITILTKRMGRLALKFGTEDFECALETITIRAISLTRSSGYWNHGCLTRARDGAEAGRRVSVVFPATHQYRGVHRPPLIYWSLAPPPHAGIQSPTVRNRAARHRAARHRRHRPSLPMPRQCGASPLPVPDPLSPTPLQPTPPTMVP